MGSSIYNLFKKENTQNKSAFSFNKETSFIDKDNLSTDISLKSQNCLLSTINHGKVLTYGKSLKKNKITSYSESDQNSIKINHHYSMKSNAHKKEISHEYIPSYLVDDERYKTNITKILKNPKVKTNKTFTKLDYCNFYKKDQLLQDFSLLIKRKKVNSVRKIYLGQIMLKNKEFLLESFPLFRDEDIGIIENWQNYIKEKILDEDCETDEELLSISNDIVYNDLEESINHINENKKSPQELVANYRGIN